MAGEVIGVAELTKFTWVVLPLPLLLIWCTRCWLYRDWTSWTTVRRDMSQLAAMAILSIWVINLGYGFNGSMQQLGQLGFYSHMFSGRTYPRNAEPGPLFVSKSREQLDQSNVYRVMHRISAHADATLPEDK